MRAVIQRVRSAAVSVDGGEISRIGTGILVFLGVATGDGGREVDYLARKISRLRIFPDEQEKMNRSVTEAGGEILVVSQFTLLGDCRKGNRPSFTAAAEPREGERLYREFIDRIASEAAVPVREGVFGAMMQVSIENDGPVTFVLDSPA